MDGWVGFWVNLDVTFNRVLCKSSTGMMMMVGREGRVTSQP